MLPVRRFYVLLCCLMFLPVLLFAQEPPLRQSIPIGMFNAYLPEDGNLAQGIPDLREVWEGMPAHWQGGEFPFEACNLVQHYWPTPMPPSETGEDRYVAWTKHFLSQVYAQTNVDGEVRLRAIVGELFPHYQTFGEQWLRDFIQAICAWEASGPQDGVLAGWYLVEEPMGGSKNYDVDAYERMVQIIDEAEQAGGFRRHDRFMDTGVDGKFITPTRFARFTRPADVIMISASSYIWLTGRTQPVYEPQWVAFPYILNFVRQIVEPDRRAHRLLMPQIHIVLQAAEMRRYRPTDDRATGQPTNWEMRQQIRKILTPDVKYTGSLIEPADGFWIFWWPGLTFDNDNRVDDWVHSRRLAEAIEGEVAELTGHAHKVRSPYTPRATRFLFHPDEPFNPNESNIPYELARSGSVLVEVRRPNGVLVERFDMGVQSAGRLERFGGPAWRPGSQWGDGRYSFRLYLDGESQDSVTVDVRTRAALSSPSHKTGFWQRENRVELVWSAPTAVDGIAGYAYLWDDSPSGEPGRSVQLPPETESLLSNLLPDGEHYFHLRHVDGRGQWSDTATLGPFLIDTTPPAFVEPPISPTHTPGEWSQERVIRLAWQAAEDTRSGLRGYALVWDHSPVTQPPEFANVGNGITELASPDLTEGEWFAHLRPLDAAGNWGQAVHLGPFRIDTTPPTRPTNLNSPTHALEVWSPQPRIQVEWQPAVDDTSSVVSYAIWWDETPDSQPPTDAFLIPDTRVLSELLTDGIHWLHAQAVDRVGLRSGVVSLGPFWIDTTSPLPATFTLTVEETGEPVAMEAWNREKAFQLTWEGGSDELSGITGTTLRVERQVQADSLAPAWETLREEDVAEVSLTLHLGDGIWRIRLITRDMAGNESPFAQTLRVDTSVAAPQLTSPTHPDPDVWYAITGVQMRWESPPDLSGIAACRWTVSEQPDSRPEGAPADESLIPTPRPGTSIDEDERTFRASRGSSSEATSATFELLTGRHFFHLLVTDNAGNEVLVHRRIRIDAEPPALPQIRSPTHLASDWTSNTRFVATWGADPPLSGIAGYSLLFDASPESIPPPVAHTQRPAYEVEPGDGIWFLHVRAQSGSGLWSETSHDEIRIDTHAPGLQLRSPSHPGEAAWSAEREVTFAWTAEDDGSGVTGYQWAWDRSPETSPDQVLDPTVSEMRFEAGEDGRYFFHLQAEDGAGNRSDVRHYRVQIDASAPGVPRVESLTHLPARWSSRRDVSLYWAEPAGLSGIAGYSVTLDNRADTLPDGTLDTQLAQVTLPGLADGVHTFHVRAQSRTGVWGSAAHFPIWIDGTLPEVEMLWPPSEAWLTQPVESYYGTATDATSGVDWETLEYRYGEGDWTLFHNDDLLMQAGLPIPPSVMRGDLWADGDEIPNTTGTPDTPVQVRVADHAGNVGVSRTTILRVDTGQPHVSLSSPTHPQTAPPISDAQPVFTWEIETGYAAIESVRIGIDDVPGGTPRRSLPTEVRIWQSEPLSDGRWYFHIAARNVAGLTSETLHWPLQIDTTPPTVMLRWRSPAREKQYETGTVTPRIGAGQMQIWLTVSEPIRPPDPYLSYRVEGYMAASSPLEPDPESHEKGESWRTTFDILPGRVPDGLLYLSWVVTDFAGNTSDPTVGDPFLVDTLLHPDFPGEQLIWGPEGARLSLPPGAIDKPIRLALLSADPPVGISPPGYIVAGYTLQAYSEGSRPLPFLDFSTPASLHLLTTDVAHRRVMLFDGVQFQPVSFLADTRVAEIRQTGDYYVLTGTQPDATIWGGWAAPNPFTPNGSGDPSDRTVFHVATHDPSVSYRITIYDLHGRRIRELPTSENRWDGRNEQGQLARGGVYLYRIRSDGMTLSGSVLLVR